MGNNVSILTSNVGSAVIASFVFDNCAGDAARVEFDVTDIRNINYGAKLPILCEQPSCDNSSMETSCANCGEDRITILETLAREFRPDCVAQTCDCEEESCPMGHYHYCVTNRISA